MRHSGCASHDSFAQSGKQPRHGYGTAIGWPGAAIHAHPVTSWRERQPQERHAEDFVSASILDRNSQVRFHETIVTSNVTKVSRARLRAQQRADLPP